MTNPIEIDDITFSDAITGNGKVSSNRLTEEGLALAYENPQKRQESPPPPAVAPLSAPRDEIKPGKLPDPFSNHNIDLGTMARPASYQPLIAPAFGSAITELGIYHHQINDIDLQAVARQQGIGPNEPLILCNFDTHSDMRNPPSPPTDEHNENVGNWVNRMIAANPQITDFYWVMPDSLKNYVPAEANKAPKDPFFNTMPQPHGNLVGSPRDLVVFVGNKTGVIRWDKPPDGEMGQYRQVGVHKRTLDEMPDMKGKHVIWTTDLDGFDNKGYGTSFDAKVPWQGEQGFSNYLNKLAQKHIRPFFHFISQSHEYTTDEHKNDLDRFAAELCAASPNGDINITNYRALSDAKPDLIPPFWGSTIKRSDDPVYGLLFQLQTIDARTTRSDGGVVIDQPNAEYDAVLAATERVYQNLGSDAERGIAALVDKFKLNVKLEQPSEKERTASKVEAQKLRAARILRNLDCADGKANGTINFRMIEYLIYAGSINREQKKRAK